MSASRVYDAGSELAYNRRRGAPPITLEQYLAMNETMRARMAFKRSLWPRPKYRDLVNSGVAPLKARLMKEIYDHLPSHAPLEATEEDYAAGIIAVRTGVEAWLREPATPSLTALGTGGDYEACKKVIREVFCTVWPGALERESRDVGYGHYGGAHERALTDRQGFSLRQERGLSQISFWSADIYADLERGWPSPLPAWHRCGLRVEPKDRVAIEKYSNADRYYLLCAEMVQGDFPDEASARQELERLGSFVLVDTNPFKTTRRDPLLRFLSFDTEEAAIAEAKARARRPRRAKEWTPPALTAEGCEFVGNDTAPAGIGSDALVARFGLKGLNFGNYVTQKERAWHLKRAWNALNDLADVMGVSDPEWMGRFGRLGLGIGAQGRGLDRAAAHYVPGIAEINLTRGAGVGSLAHEYGHALDNATSELLGHAVKAAEYLSGRVGLSSGPLENGNMRTYTDAASGAPGASTALTGAMRAVIHRLCWKLETEEEFSARLGKEKARAVADLEAAFRAAAQRVPNLEKELLSLSADLSLSGCPSMEELREDRTLRGRFAGLRRRMLQLTGRCRRVANVGLASFYGIRSSERAFHFTLEGRAGKQGPQERQTAFYSNAVAMDEGRKPYWATPHELFARAFADWVDEALQRKGRRNDYLTRNCREAYAEAKNEGKATGNPHLSSRELAWIYPAMEQLVNVIVALNALARRKEQDCPIEESLAA